MGAISQINSKLEEIATLINLPYFKGRIEDMGVTLEKPNVTYPLLWCFPLTNTGTFLNNYLYNKTYQVPLVFLQISETNIDRSPESDFNRIEILEDIADEFIYRFNQLQDFGQIDSISQSEVPLYNEYSHVVSAISLVFNITLNTGVCFDD